MATVWILTEEYNDYDQYGEYFLKVYANKPTHQQLTLDGVCTDQLRHVLNGGGRTKKFESHWYHLREHTPI